MVHEWSNWSGAVTCSPQTLATPASEAAVLALVQQARCTDRTIRVVGSGHSFTPLCATDSVLVSLDHLQGMVAVDPIQETATVWAGTKLYNLGEPLWTVGLAMANLGDIDRQTLAGAISTGTHGTGHT